MAKLSSCCHNDISTASTVFAILLYMHMYLYMYYYLFMHIDRKLHVMSTMIVFTMECMKLSCLIFDNANVSLYT